MPKLSKLFWAKYVLSIMTAASFFVALVCPASQITFYVILGCLCAALANVVDLFERSITRENRDDEK